MKKILSTLVLFVLLVLAFKSYSQQTSYHHKINSWFAARDKQLKSIESPLSFVGLHWLHEGKNTFGSAKDNELVLPDSIASAHAGYYLLNGDSITLHLVDKSIIPSQQQAINSKNIPVEDVYKYKLSPQTIGLTKGSYQWFIINNKGRLGIRVFDAKSLEQRHFKGVERYPADSAFQVFGKFYPYESNTIRRGFNVAGKPISNEVLGELTFTLNNEPYALEAFESNGEYFIVFSDKTGESSSYPFRFLYVPVADADGNVLIDFNHALNPNCAYSKYSFCPMPPEQNRLTIAIPVGEKKYELINK